MPVRLDTISLMSDRPHCDRRLAQIEDAYRNNRKGHRSATHNAQNLQHVSHQIAVFVYLC